MRSFPRMNMNSISVSVELMEFVLIVEPVLFVGNPKIIREITNSRCKEGKR
jgi:hypothetical protein